jgi:hypothetical protein
MTAAEDAYRAATAYIEEARKRGVRTLDLDQDEFRALEHLPDNIVKLTHVTTLDLSNLPISDISALRGFSQLQTLRLSRTQITDFTPLQSLTRLKGLDLSGTQITDITPLQELAGLRKLDLAYTQVTDITPLKNLSGLQTLFISGTQVNDLRPIADLRSLRDGALQGLYFRETPAASASQELRRLTEIRNSQQRTRETQAYLKTLPPWPEPLPWEEGPPREAGTSDDKPPSVPVETPAPLRVLFDNDVLRPARPGDGLDEEAHRRAVQGWDTLRDYLADLADQRPRIGNAMPRLERSMGRLETLLNEAYDAINSISVGIQGTRFIRLSKGAQDALLDEDAADIEEFAAALELFLERFPEWRRYKDDAIQQVLDTQDVTDSLPELEDLTEDLAARPWVDDKLPPQLNDLIKAVREDPEDALTTTGLVRSASNVLRAISEKAIAGAKILKREGVDILSDAWKKTKTGLSVAIASTATAGAIAYLASGGTVLRALATRFPEHFGWIEGVLRFLGL